MPRHLLAGQILSLRKAAATQEPVSEKSIENYHQYYQQGNQRKNAEVCKGGSQKRGIILVPLVEGLSE
jgi:hypothetical protein